MKLIALLCHCLLIIKGTEVVLYKLPDIYLLKEAQG